MIAYITGIIVCILGFIMLHIFSKDIAFFYKQKLYTEIFSVLFLIFIFTVVFAILLYCIGTLIAYIIEL